MLKKWWNNYLQKETKWGHFSNAVFVLFIILMMIPSTRAVVHKNIIKLTLFDWGSMEKEDGPVLNAIEKQVSFFNADEKISLGNLENEVVLINYWATWCPPCVAEMPYLQSLYDSHGDRVKFIFASNDDLTKITSFMEENDYSFPVYAYSNQIASMEHNGIPATFIIDKNSKLVFSHTGAYKWDAESVRSFLDDLLQE